MPKLEFLDHVAIKVKDPEASALWYTSVLGLKRYQPEEWKPVPIMVFAGSSGIALFGDNGEPVPQIVKESIHMAFRLAPGDYDDALRNLTNNSLEYVEQDHKYFRSVYFRDPDGYRLELTMPTDIFLNSAG